MQNAGLFFLVPAQVFHWRHRCVAFRSSLVLLFSRKKAFDCLAILVTWVQAQQCGVPAE